VLERRRQDGLLGNQICGKADFDFDIRIQLGAGAYICGEETALISSSEGLRGEPKNRPPFPAQSGYLSCPTTVNNVETLCGVARIMDRGPAWFNSLGSQSSAGTKLLSVSGDCLRPGVYEVPLGIRVEEVLKLAGAENVLAVQVGGASGRMIGQRDFNRAVCYDDLATGGAVMIFNQSRDLLEIVQGFVDFFVEESCGYCTPCRVGTVLMQKLLHQIRTGRGTAEDLSRLRRLAETVKLTSRCGLGQTAGNPILTTCDRFRAWYEKQIPAAPKGDLFDLTSSVAESSRLVGREALHPEGMKGKIS
jgi:[NiFe] hydrogenase diaphorase moiety large subunit